MEQRLGEEKMAAAQRLVKELICQGERCALAAFPQQAEAILAQTWAFAEQDFPELSDTAAWDLALLRLGDQDYTGAAEWFGRINAPPSIQSQLWSEQRQMLIQTCHQLISSSCASPKAAAAPATSEQQSARTDRAIPRLTITNLGRFQVARDDEPLPICRSRKAIELFRYLLSCSHRTAHREELMDVLWPDAHPHAAAHSLHVAVSTLRRYLGLRADSYLVFAAGRYALNPQAPIEDDSLAFLQLNDEAEHFWRSGNLHQAGRAYAQAITYYQGDYYVEDHDLAWALTERERLLARYLLALDRLGRIWMQQRHFNAAADCYQRLVQRDEYREDAYCQLMRCYLQLGRRGDALRQYQCCASILASDLGLVPMEEMQELYQAISGT
jgi:DNA-binding SARP family transcriptional activator